MWRCVPLVIVHEKYATPYTTAEQWRLKACNDHGRSLCSRVYPTSEAAAVAQQELAAILRGLDGELALRALQHWMREDGGKPSAKKAQQAGTQDPLAELLGLDDEDRDA